MAAARGKGDELSTEVNIFAVLTDAVAANHLHCSALLSAHVIFAGFKALDRTRTSVKRGQR